MLHKSNFIQMKQIKAGPTKNGCHVVVSVDKQKAFARQIKMTDSMSGKK